MYKKTVVLGLMMSIFGFKIVNATLYDDCIRDFRAKSKEIGDYEYAICMKQEAARILTEIQKGYTKIANDSHYTKWNNGNGMFKGRVRDTYNAWLVYRNNYCDLIAEASKTHEGLADYSRENCKVNLGKEQQEALNNILDAQAADPE